MSEQDQPSWRPMAAVLGAVMAGILVSVVIVFLLDDLHTHGGGRTDIVTRGVAFSIASEQFDEITGRELQRMVQIQRLHGWSWADAEHRHMRMPIERAIDRYLEEHAR